MPILNAREVLAGELPVEELGISLLDEFTMQITLTGPDPVFPGLAGQPGCVSGSPRERRGIRDQFSRPGNLVSNGAYVLKAWTPRVSIELEKNPNYP